MSILIGIDLGTSTTEAAVYRNGKPEMILNLEGEAVIPSAVGIDDAGNWIAGARARAQYLLSPDRTAIEVKRKTGSGETIALGSGKYTPVELQQRLLSYVRTYVSEYLGENVDRAVISVPAYFDHTQRRETILAGEKAGFVVDRILNEPTAAAMTYGLEHMEEDSHVLVYDLGGGTFDVTLLEMFSGVLEVKASAGDNRLGGKDFDEKLMEELYHRFQKKHHVDLRKDRLAAARVKEAAERCKVVLSEQDSAQVRLPALCVVKGEPLEMNELVTRADFEALTADLLVRTHAPLDTVLKDAGLSEEQIDHIILVGGATRMPMIARDIRQYLGKDPAPAVHPQFAVAMGAAIQAGIISGEIDPMEGLIMTDVSAFSLGVRAGEGRGDQDDDDLMSVVIPRNITIPTRRTETYCTAADGQRIAKIEVYQGESRLVSHNQFLGEFLIHGIPPRARGKEKIEVTFAYDLNGMLSVTARIVSTGKEASIDINMKDTDQNAASQKDPDRASGRKKEQLPDLSGWKDAEGAKEYRSLIRMADRLLKQVRSSADVPESLRNELQDTLTQLKQALIDGRLEDTLSLSRALDKTLKAVEELL